MFPIEAGDIDKKDRIIPALPGKDMYLLYGLPLHNDNCCVVSILAFWHKWLLCTTLVVDEVNFHLTM